jgi:hypothetical protein
MPPEKSVAILWIMVQPEPERPDFEGVELRNLAFGCRRLGASVCR